MHHCYYFSTQVSRPGLAVAFQFIPFGGGPRNCIGMRFALIEIKLVLVKVLRKFQFVRLPETQVPVVMVPGITLTARDGVQIRVELVK